MANPLMEKLAKAATEDLDFEGAEEKEWKVCSHEEKARVAEAFLAYVDTVDMAASMFLPSAPMGSGSSQALQTAKLLAFRSELRGEAETFYASLDVKVKRDYESLSRIFERKYSNPMDEKDEKAERKRQLERF